MDIGPCQMALLVALGPLVTGVIQKIKARLQCRCGAGIIQPYRDLLKLLRKAWFNPTPQVRFFALRPALVLAATCAAAALVPVFFAPRAAGYASLLPLGDAILLVGWLALARFFTGGCGSGRGRGLWRHGRVARNDRGHLGGAGADSGDIFGRRRGGHNRPGRDRRSCRGEARSVLARLIFWRFLPCLFCCWPKPGHSRGQSGHPSGAHHAA